VKNLFVVIALMVMIRLMKQGIEKKIIFLLYALWFLFALDMMRHAFTGAIFLNQVMILAEALSGLAVLGWSLKYGVLTPSYIKTTRMIRLFVFRAFAIFAMTLFTAGLVSGILGYLLPAHFFVSSVIVGGATALELFVFIKIFMGFAAFCLRVWPLRLLLIVSRHRNLLERRLYRILTWVAMGVWLIRVLDYVGLFQPALLLGKALLDAKLERGSVSISLGDVFAFILAVLIARYLSRFLCFILNEDVFPRTKVSHGVRYATTRLIDYLIMVFGFLIGVGLVGIDLTKVTVLIGAFSVGIGFGLQSVVNNFVSGLILLFERPIQMGDTIEVGNILGTVRRIGIRASILRSRQGAEIIIPNSQLISEQVTNWTLSDRRRRVDLPIGVNYDSKPQKVIEVIEAVASAHPRVLKKPPPGVLLTGFGDSAINYELRAWTDESNEDSAIRSELAVAVYDAIRAAGMLIPCPQREVRLIKDSET
jgi:small-conductance mechanosensitive channel